MTQDAADLLGTELGQAVVANAATRSAAPGTASDRCGRIRVPALGGGAGIPAVRDQGPGLDHPRRDARAAFQSAASPAENKIATTDPAELHDMADQEDSHDEEDDL